MKKRIMMFSSVTALVTLLVAGGTMAWFTSNPEVVTNDFTAGTVNIGINENGFVPVTNWNPGQTSKKNVDITINSSKQTYVRVKLTPSWNQKSEKYGKIPATDANGANLPLDYVELNFTDTSKWVFENGTHPDPTMKINDARLSGYLYYTDIVTSKDISINLLETVKFLSGVSNDYQGKIFSLGVKAEGVQASHEAYKGTWAEFKDKELPKGVAKWTE